MQPMSGRSAVPATPVATGSDAPQRARSPLWRGLRLAIVAMVIVSAWLAFAPPRLGGNFSYVFIFGESMEPTVREGDLVLLRRHERYAVGDIIAYVDPVLGQVFHRVIGRDGATYVTQGDNRPNVDPFQPRHAEILGSQWAHIPRGGSVVRAVQEPRNTLLLLGATVVLSVSTRAARPARRRRGRGRAATASRPLAYGSLSGDLLLSGGVALLAAAGVLAAVTWSSPTTRTVRVDVPYSQGGAFDYGGPGPSALYDGATIEPGDPVFTQLTRRLPVRFTYTLAPEFMDPLGEVTGVIALDAVLTQENGWRRTFPVAASQPFTGAEATVAGSVDLAAMRALASEMQEATGLAFLEFGVALEARVETEATLGGQPLTERYEQALRFRLTPFDLRLLTREEPLEAAASGLLLRPEERTRTVSIPAVDWEIGYPALRRAAVGAGGGGALLLAIAGVATLLVQRAGEAARIQARHGRLLVSVRARDIDFSGRIIGVASFEDLVRIATADGLLILHTESDAADHYMVVEPEATYVYEVPRDDPEPPHRWDPALLREVLSEDPADDDPWDGGGAGGAR